MKVPVKKIHLCLILSVFFLTSYTCVFGQETITKRLYLDLSSNATILSENGNTSLLLKNYLGSSVMSINGKNDVNTSVYYPDGNQSSGSIASDRLFTSHRKLDNLAIYSAGARFYSPTTGTFIQPDQKEGPNRYAYVSNNPISFTDPSGTNRESALVERVVSWVTNEGGSMIDSTLSEEGVNSVSSGSYVPSGNPKGDPLHRLANYIAEALFGSGSRSNTSNANNQRSNQARRLSYGADKGGKWGGNAIDANVHSRAFTAIANKIRARYGSRFDSYSLEDKLRIVAEEVYREIPYDHSNNGRFADQASSNTMIFQYAKQNGAQCRHQAGICRGVLGELGISSREIVFDVPNGAHTAVVVNNRSPFIFSTLLSESTNQYTVVDPTNNDVLVMPAYAGRYQISNLRYRSNSGEGSLKRLPRAEY